MRSACATTRRRTAQTTLFGPKLARYSRTRMAKAMTLLLIACRSTGGSAFGSPRKSERLAFCAAGPEALDHATLRPGDRQGSGGHLSEPYGGVGGDCSIRRDWRCSA